MAALRSPRLAAAMLAFAALVGLVAANSPAGAAVVAARDLHLGPLSLGHWVTDGLLAVFFLVAAMELRHELSHGQLDSPRKALVPAVAAVGGVAVPALLFLVFVQDPELARGWPIPTATDIAFALGVLALVGRGLPARVRALLLALAVIDDLIAIVLIAFIFTASVQAVPLLVAIPVVLVFGWLGTRAGRWRIPVMVLLGIAVWILVLLSGVHPTIAGVALGLALPAATADPLRHAIEPWTNAVILPVFAFTAALVVIPAVDEGISPVFWAILIALPLGKLVGITLGALVASGFTMPIGDVLVVAALGGIGFTVSLLMNELAFADHPVAAQGTLAVLAGSLVSIVLGGTLTALRARRARRRSAR